ncbi:MAG TPA: hypothetical protein VEZ40_16395, partial [Pyrinomonadaceae bacterium]|nr:hypothetical protein [Pyrinomonadaceae bacterium]
MRIRISNTSFYLGATIVIIAAFLTTGCNERRYKVTGVKIIGNPVDCNTVSAADGLVIKDGKADGTLNIVPGAQCAVAEVTVSRTKSYAPGGTANLVAFFLYQSSSNPLPDQWFYYQVADEGQDKIIFPRVIVAMAQNEQLYNLMKEANAVLGLKVYFGYHGERGNFENTFCCFFPKDPGNKVD